MFTSLLTIIGLLLLINWLFIKPYNYWTLRNVPQKFALPIVGNQLSVITRRTSFAEFVKYVYEMFPDWRYSGFYQMTVPTLVLKDLDLIKQITVKYFDHFTDHHLLIPEDVEPLWGKNLFSLRGEKWRNMRSTLSPSFTSSKMKTMFVLISDCAENFVKHFQNDMKTTAELKVEMKGYLTRFTNDVIATTAFGISCDSLTDRNNHFYLMAKDAVDLTGLLKNIKLFIAKSTPKLTKLLNIKIFNDETSNFFYNVIKDTIKIREERNIVRSDMINILMEAKKGKTKEEKPIPDAGFSISNENIEGNVEGKHVQLTDVDITAQALIFLFAGFDSIANLMTFTSYELATNPEVQQRLQQEIDETFEECDGTVTYEALMKMKYLDMILSESLRKWPAAVAVDRVCVKPFTIEPVHKYESAIHLNVGDVLWLPIFAIHRDEKYYPDPDKYDPERFNDDNKSKLNPYNYMPFGVGPRICIGSRFVLLEAKILTFHILRNFTFVPTDKTTIPVQISKKQYLLSCGESLHLGMKRRI